MNKLKIAFSQMIDLIKLALQNKTKFYALFFFIFYFV
ncbi:MAG: hypothetical protein RL154_471, partial [Pseudomonadota bacterium]